MPSRVFRQSPSPASAGLFHARSAIIHLSGAQTLRRTGDPHVQHPAARQQPAPRHPRSAAAPGAVLGDDGRRGAVAGAAPVGGVFRARRSLAGAHRCAARHALHHQAGHRQRRHRRGPDDPATGHRRDVSARRIACRARRRQPLPRGDRYLLLSAARRRLSCPAGQEPGVPRLLHAPHRQPAGGIAARGAVGIRAGARRRKPLCAPAGQPDPARALERAVRNAARRCAGRDGGGTHRLGGRDRCRSAPHRHPHPEGCAGARHPGRGAARPRRSTQ